MRGLAAESVDRVVITPPTPGEIVARLEARYGPPVPRTRLDPLEELIQCILSQHTSDTNSWRAYERLRDAFPTWDAVVAADPGEVADAIRTGGLADSKSVRIQQTLVEIATREGAYDLTRLGSLADAEARDYLLSLHGVGPKTAAIVLCFALDRPVIPVDTHVFRVAWRLGLIQQRLGEGRAHDALQAQIPGSIIYRFHVALIRHGRDLCKAQRPRCAECPLADGCAFGLQQRSAQT